ncbi:MAG TPA: class I SAM-dependent methyltransferase [Rhizomicrobium sp.]|jgi:SAM-dependent methyltransferase
MTQNIYDQDNFFAGYSRLRRSQEGLAGAPEWASLQAMLPDMTDKRVLDLGCGFGWFCRWAREHHGAAEVLGIDVSEKMLARARVTTSDPAIGYARGDMETLTLARDSYDLVYSSLAFHYIADLARLFGEIHASLAPGGAFVFSVEHPLYTAPSEPGWTESGGRKTWPLDSYLKEGPRRTDWLAKDVLKYHRSLSTYLNTLLATGFTLRYIEEWGPTDAQLAANPALAEERDRPTFLLVSARR